MNLGALDQIVAAFQGHGGAWGAALLPYALELFFGLAIIQFGLRVGYAFAQRVELPELLTIIVQEIVTTGFFYWFLLNSAQFLKAIIDSFRQVANSASVAGGGSQNMRPSDIFGAGTNMAHAIWQGMSWDHPLLGFLLVIAGVICAVCFAIVCAMMIEVLIESTLVSYIGVLMMGFGGSSYTREYAIAQIRYAISVGVKLFVMQLLVGISEAIIIGWSHSIASSGTTTDWTTVGVMIGVPIVMLRLVWKLPQVAQDVVNGSIGNTHGGLLSTGAGVAGAAGGAVASIAGAGVAGGAALRLAGKQMQQNMQSADGQDGSAGGGGNAPAQSRITQAAMMGGYAARNLARAGATDVGKRLTGQPGASYGYRGWRMAADQNRQATAIGNRISKQQAGSNTP